MLYLIGQGGSKHHLQPTVTMNDENVLSHSLHSHKRKRIGNSKICTRNYREGVCWNQRQQLNKPNFSDLRWISFTFVRATYVFCCRFNISVMFSFFPCDWYSNKDFFSFKYTLKLHQSNWLLEKWLCKFYKKFIMSTRVIHLATAPWTWHGPVAYPKLSYDRCSSVPLKAQMRYE